MSPYNKLILRMSLCQIQCILKFSFVLLIVLAMESQAEDLGQLTTDDLEGKVVVVLLNSNFYLIIIIAS